MVGVLVYGSCRGDFASLALLGVCDVRFRTPQSAGTKPVEASSLTADERGSPWLCRLEIRPLPGKNKSRARRAARPTGLHAGGIQKRAKLRREERITRPQSVRASHEILPVLNSSDAHAIRASTGSGGELQNGHLRIPGKIMMLLRRIPADEGTLGTRLRIRNTFRRSRNNHDQHFLA